MYIWQVVQYVEAFVGKDISPMLMLCLLTNIWQVVQYVEAFVGKDISAMHTMLINKPPDPGKSCIPEWFTIVYT